MSVDEIQFFEASVQQVQSEQNAFYNEMIQIVSPADLAQLDQIIQKAKNYLYAKNSETSKQWSVYLKIPLKIYWLNLYIFICLILDIHKLVFSIFIKYINQWNQHFTSFFALIFKQVFSPQGPFSPYLTIAIYPTVFKFLLSYP